jgi:hypothetical protein
MNLLDLGMFRDVVRWILIFFGLIAFSFSANGQSFQSHKASFFAPSDTFNQKRFNYALGISAATYAGFSVGLYHAWYKQYPQGDFHFFNDFGEWNNMDKVGHIYTAYFQGVLCYKGAKWTGLSDDKAILVGAICGSLFQTTIEVMDGFSTQWGFSLTDMGANAAGIGIYALQQKYWKEQRISLKVSSIPEKYPNYIVVGSQGTQVSLQERADNLFGSSFGERFLKDYNAQVYWASINVKSFLPIDHKWPDWLNVAVGYGADNLFGGFENEWSAGQEKFSIDVEAFPRVHQFYLGLDLNLSGIKTNNHLLKGILSMFDIFKAPSPALELNSRGEFTFHILR